MLAFYQKLVYVFEFKHYRRKNNDKKKEYNGTESFDTFFFHMYFINNEEYI